MNFCDYDKLYVYFDEYGPTIAKLTIPDDAIVCVEINRFRTNKFVIESISKLNEIDGWQESREKCVMFFHIGLKYFDDIPFELYKKVISKRSVAIKYVKNISSDEYDQLIDIIKKKNMMVND
jgi:hypothetical protein